MIGRRFGRFGVKRNFTLLYQLIGDDMPRMRFFGLRRDLEAFISQNSFIDVLGIYWRSNFNKNLMDRYL